MAFFVAISTRDMWIFTQRSLFLISIVYEGSIVFFVVMSVGECDTIVWLKIMHMGAVLPVGEQVVCTGYSLGVVVLSLKEIIFQILNEAAEFGSVCSKKEGYS